MDLMDCLSPLSAQHQTALTWFQQQRGSLVSWPAKLDDDTFLVTKTKEVYKPSWSHYALSVRQTLNSPCADEEPVVYPDGSWTYRYFPENPDPSKRDNEYINVALMRCLEAEVPVALMIQSRPRPGVKYNVLGLALVTGWHAGYFHFEGFNDEQQLPVRRTNPNDVIADDGQGLAEIDGRFDPADQHAARMQILAAIVRRRGQDRFHGQLFQAYAGRCAITGADVIESLEAAHITPCPGPEANRVANGLLLRADIHTLWDLGLLAVDESNHQILLADELQTSYLAPYLGQALTLPEDRQQWPSPKALKAQRQFAGL
ncbi:MAG: putative restriction endonuclease [Motiliproteus sp.]|jgi:putative restriction endonuclease